MKIFVLIIRILLGTLFVFSAIAYFFELIPTPALEGDLKTFNEGLAAAGYLLPLVKGTELLCGLALLAGRYVPLALIVLFPIIINIMGVHLSLAPEGLPVALFALTASLFLAYIHREKYLPLFRK
ncbi:DoxX family membrane protein [Dyadobacter tibetensis]|uniref:DoxX family membrane protein n=1 Tax=Dyadobacter tibetensis TaxID=1211851 RepID=UPI000470C0AF|nr:DoxX family membrane protein [Dyadobacter tibetensis]